MLFGEVKLYIFPYRTIQYIRNLCKIYYYRQYTDKKIIWHILDKNYLIGSYFHGY